MISEARALKGDWKRRAEQLLRTLAGFVAWVCMLSFPIASSAAPSNSVWTQWITTLKSSGFVVTQGVSAPHDCKTYIAVFGNCSGNNPSGGYYDILPPVDDSYVDPCYNPAHDCSGATPSSYTILATLPDGGKATVNQFYRLGPTDALVVIVTLPPNAAYFGYQSYVYSRPRSAYSSTGCALMSSFPDHCRTPVRGSVGNAINEVSLSNQAGITLSKGGVVAFITTANPALYSSLASAFRQVGGAPSLLFAEPLAEKIVAGPYTASVNPGVGSSADEMNTLIRYTLPQSQSDADAWDHALSNNVQVFRIRNAGVGTTRYGSTTLAVKHYSTDESTYKTAVDELTGDLKLWLQSQTTSPVRVFAMASVEKISKTGQPATAVGLDYIGPYCLANGTDCLRDTQDTDTYRVFILPTSLNHTAAFVGVDSTQTDNAAYIGVGVSNDNILEGIASLSQTNPRATGFSSGTLTGSASDLVAYLSAAGLIPAPSSTLKAALPKLFVALATRDCPSGATEFFCAKKYTMNIDATEIPLNDRVQLTRRTYVHPGDTNGPNPNYIFPTQIVY